MPSEAELVAAIYEHPGDLAARSVYGDWLAERGDPRGEFIALQLGRSAVSAAPAARRRERELIRAYHDTWVGELGSWFEPGERVFEDGMFAGGRLRQISEPVDLDRMLRDPLWRLVRTIDLRGAHSQRFERELLDRPELVSLRAVFGLSEATAAAIADGPERPLTAFGWHKLTSWLPPEPLATCRALPALRELSPPEVHVDWLGEAPVVERLERVVLLPHGGLSSALATLAVRGGALRHLVLLPHYIRRTDDDWQIELSRSEAPGPFTRLAATHRSGGPNWFTSGLAVLDRVPAEWIRELVIEAERVPLLSAHERTQLAALEARFVHATKRVPRNIEPRTESLALQARLEGTGLLDPETVRALWPILIDQLGQRYSTLRTNDNFAQRPLGKKPLERIATWAERPTTQRLQLARDGRDSSVELHRGDGVINSFALDVQGTSLDEIVAAFARIVELGTFRRGRLGIGFIDANAGAFAIPEHDKVPEAGWLVVFGPAFAAVLPTDEVATLATHPLLGGLHVVPAERHRIIAIAATPDEVSAERLRAAAHGLHTIITRHTIAKLGFDIRERAIAVLAAPAARAHLEAVTDPERQLSQRFVHQKRPVYELRVAIERPLEAPVLVCTLQVVKSGRVTASRVIANTLVTERTIDEALANAGRRVAAEANDWFRLNG